MAAHITHDASIRQHHGQSSSQAYNQSTYQPPSQPTYKAMNSGCIDNSKPWPWPSQPVRGTHRQYHAELKAQIRANMHVKMEQARQLRADKLATAAKRVLDNLNRAILSRRHRVIHVVAVLVYTCMCVLSLPLLWQYYFELWLHTTATANLGLNVCLNLIVSGAVHAYWCIVVYNLRSFVYEVVRVSINVLCWLCRSRVWIDSQAHGLFGQP